MVKDFSDVKQHVPNYSTSNSILSSHFTNVIRVFFLNKLFILNIILLNLSLYTLGGISLNDS